MMAGSRRSVAQPDSAVEARRRVDVEHPHRLFAVVAEAVLDPGRDEHERSGRRDRLVVAEEERQLTLQDVERVVLVGVDVRLELAAGADFDDPEREARGVDRSREELDVADAVSLARRNYDWLGTHA